MRCSSRGPLSANARKTPWSNRSSLAPIGARLEGEWREPVATWHGRGGAPIDDFGLDDEEFAYVEDVGTEPSESPAVDDV